MLGVLPFLGIQGQSVIRADEEKWRYRTRPIYLTYSKYGSLNKKPELLYLVPGAARNMLFFDCALLCMRSDVGSAAPLIVPYLYRCQVVPTYMYASSFDESFVLRLRHRRW